MVTAALPVVADPTSERIKALIQERLRMAKTYWRPLHARMDYWANMYLMLDPIQQAKPIGVARRFVSNSPRTGPDAAMSILTRHPTSWRIDMMNADDENSEERRTIGRIERTLQGLCYDMDELFSMRMKPSLWKQIAFQALIRGMIWGKFHVTTEALKYRDSPIIPEIWDAPTVYPHVDDWGLNHVMVEKLTTLGNLVASYPERFGKYEGPGYDPNTPAVKIEFWSNDRGERKGITAVLGVIGSPAATTTPGFNAITGGIAGGAVEWVIPPYFHGYSPRDLPVVGVPANGVSMDYKPHISSVLEQRLTERADLLAMEALNWHGPSGHVAEVGRSILHAVEEQVPQYNELIATIFQHLSIGTYGTWVFHTPTGQQPEFSPGIETKIALMPHESLDRIEPSPITPDAYRLVQMLDEEREKGVLSNILHAVGPFQGTGVLFQQITNSALNALEPYDYAIKQFGTRFGTCVLGQLQRAAPMLRPFELVTPTPKHTYFRIEFDPAADLDQTRHYRPVPILKPALPDDLTARMTAARMALDPRRPMLSLVTVLEEILKIDDPSGEVDRIFEDLAMNDPVLLPEQMAQAFERLNEPELAARMRETEFAARLVEDAKLRQLTQNIPQGPGGEMAMPSPDAGVSPVSTQRTGTEQSLPEGGQGAGVMGATVGV
jgi:hypothetical protein